MKLLKSALLASAAVVLMAGVAQAATTSATGNASATVTNVYAIEHDDLASLAFGNVIPGGAAVTVAPTSGDSFSVTGNNTVDLTADNVTVTAPEFTDGTRSATPTMTKAYTGTLAGGDAKVRVGGTLQVPANFLAGNYSDTYDVTITY